MKTWTIAILISLAAAAGAQPTPRQLTYRDYLDKTRGGWVGKVAGLTLGVPKEFGEPWPPSKGDYFAEVPTHFSDLYSGDDLYFPLLAQVCLKKYGTHPTQDQYMAEWKARLYTGRVWGVNANALEHAFAGVHPPKTGYPGWNNGHDLDAQIDFDTAGWVAPGLINASAAIADNAGHLMCWGDGVDGAVFVAALISESYFNTNVETAIRSAQAVLPAVSPYRSMIDDVIRWHTENPDWRMTRKLLGKKYSPDARINEYSAVVNGGAVLIGLLYGENDFGKTVSIAMRCRWDSDCNAATAGAILGTMQGYSHMDPRWTEVFHDSYENYCIKGLPRWMRISDIARDSVEIGEQVIRENGGSVSGQGEQRVFTIPLQKTVQLTREEVYSPELIAANEREMRAYYNDKLKNATESFDPTWTMTWAAFENPPTTLDSYMGRKKVLKAQPGWTAPVVLERTLDLVAGKHHYLRVGVAHPPNILNEQTGRDEIGNWKLEVRVDGKKLGDYTVGTQGGLVVWEDPEFDLSPYAGKTVNISLLGRPNMAYTEFYLASQTTYWSGIELVTQDQPEPWR